MAISLNNHESRIKALENGAINSMSLFTAVGTPSTGSIVGNPSYIRIGENFCSFNGGNRFSLTKGRYMIIASLWHRNDSDGSGSDHIAAINVNKNGASYLRQAGQATAHWGGDTNILHFAAESNGSDIYDIYMSESGWSLGGRYNGNITIIKLSNNL